MTEKLKQLMHERTDSVDFAMPDLETLAREGDRRIRRRRAGVLAGGLAAAAVTAAVVVPQLRGGSDPVQFVDLPATNAVSWARDGVIHVGGTTVDVGHDVNAYVRTVSGYVVADSDGTVWSVTDAGVDEVGSTNAKFPRLVADDEGSLAGWVDASGDVPAFVVLDQDTGDVTRNDDGTEAGMGDLADEANPAYFYGIDGDTAYWRDTRGAVAVDIPSGNARVVEANARNGFDIVAVENGDLAFSRGAGTAIGPNPQDAVLLPEVWGSRGAFSPDGRLYTADADEPQIYDTRTGDRVEVDLDLAFATGTEWLDNSTVVVLGSREAAMSAEAELHTCTVPDGVCTKVDADLGTFEEVWDSVALPSGESYGD